MCIGHLYVCTSTSSCHLKANKLLDTSHLPALNITPISFCVIFFSQCHFSSSAKKLVSISFLIVSVQLHLHSLLLLLRPQLFFAWTEKQCDLLSISSFGRFLGPCSSCLYFLVPSKLSLILLPSSSG